MEYMTFNEAAGRRNISVRRGWQTCPGCPVRKSAVGKPRSSGKETAAGAPRLSCGSTSFLWNRLTGGEDFRRFLEHLR
jgi:hypothetical protein